MGLSVDSNVHTLARSPIANGPRLPALDAPTYQPFRSATTVRAGADMFVESRTRSIFVITLAREDGRTALVLLRTGK